MANNIFGMLCNNLCDANSQHPENSILCMGFTKTQMSSPTALISMLKPGSGLKPRLFWYNKEDDTFYDQGDSTKVKKKDYAKINQDTFNRKTPVRNIRFYIPINNDIIKESDKPLD